MTTPTTKQKKAKEYMGIDEVLKEFREFSKTSLVFFDTYNDKSMHLEDSFDIEKIEEFIIKVYSQAEARGREEATKEMITELHNIRGTIHGYISVTEISDLLTQLKEEK